MVLDAFMSAHLIVKKIYFVLSGKLLVRLSFFLFPVKLPLWAFFLEELRHVGVFLFNFLFDLVAIFEVLLKIIQIAKVSLLVRLLRLHKLL